MIWFDPEYHVEMLVIYIVIYIVPAKSYLPCSLMLKIVVKFMYFGWQRVLTRGLPHIKSGPVSGRTFDGIRPDKCLSK